MSEKKVQKFYTEEFKRQAVELMLHSGRSIVQIGRELGVSEASLHLWRKRYGVSSKATTASQPSRSASPEELLASKPQRDILSLVLSNAPFASNTADCPP